MNVVVGGNGIVALQTARELVRERPDLHVTLIGPAARGGSASLAAAAMFNSFCEVDTGTFASPFERLKFDFNRAAAPAWPDLLDDLRAESGLQISAGFGTFLINNAVTDTLEDENYEAVRAALVAQAEPFEDVDPRAIPGYDPAPHARALRAVWIPREGWVNPVHLVAALDLVLAKEPRVRIVDGCVDAVEVSGEAVSGMITDTGERIGGDVFVLAPGASFSAIVDRSRLPISFQRVFYGAGASIRLNTGAATLTNCVRTPNRGLACGTYAAPQDASHTLVGASNFISPVPVDAPRLTSVMGLLEGAVEQINRSFYRAELSATNFGWRPTSSDTLPMIGGTDLPNLLVATGTKRDGLHCSPLIARILTALACGRTPSFDVGAFKPDRPVTRTMTREHSVRTLVRHTLNAAYQHGFRSPHNRMTEDLAAHYTREFEALHDAVGAHDWGIPPEMKDMYRYGHVRAPEGTAPLTLRSV
ncbi:MAG TPA: FAD-dependent oxidoreductase [Candidatus Elarobacter sp.]|jgi:glycine/D-amino acid oxidase-like deaminating enzyme